MQLINGKKIARQILEKVRQQIKRQNIKAHLAVILVGQNPASHLYVSIKEKKAKKIGIKFTKYLLPAKTSQSKIINLIQQLNQNKKITAILVQLPLPKRLNTDKIISAIKPTKDADGIHPDNLKLLLEKKRPSIMPATTGAIIEALKAVKAPLSNKSIAIIGKSKIVGLPTYYYLKNKCRRVNIYDRQSQNLALKTRRADILIVAIGQPYFINANYIKPGAIIIDVGINKLNGKTVGDVDFKNVLAKTKAITPVPGGIGPITVARLLKNVLFLAKRNKN